MKLKKIAILGGAFTTISLVIPMTVSCSFAIKAKHYKILPTYTGEADQLIALGIAPDYYPYQLNETSAFKYLTNPEIYMHHQLESNPSFAKDFSNKIHSLYSQIGDKGRSWWNLNAEKNDNTNPNPEYWTLKSGDLTFYEHYLLDDDKKIIESDQSPSHNVSIQTNFRWSQDPYTRLPKEDIIDTFDNKNTLRPLAQRLQRIFGLRTKDLSKPIESMWNGNEAKMIMYKWDTTDHLYSDAWFAYQWHTGFLDNDVLKVGGEAENFSNFLVNRDGSSTEKIFNQDDQIDTKLATLFAKATLPDEVKSAGLSGINYKDIKLIQKRHHPIYDAQTQIGEAPMYEGARRENMLYLYNLASQLEHATKGKNANGVIDSRMDTTKTFLENDFKGDHRWDKMQNALKNANSIAGDFNERLSNIKDYFISIGANDKVVSLTTIAPGGGISTIQTNSKYSFMFDKIGLKYPMPNNFEDIYSKGEVVGIDSVFSMDDNGWFWNIGTGQKDLSLSNHFKNTADIQILAVRGKEWDGMNDITRANLMRIQKNGSLNELGKSRVDYDLWNEGLKTPFVLNMILDDLIDRIEKHVGKKIGVDRDKALDWGNYWTQEFIK